MFQRNNRVARRYLEKVINLAGQAQLSSLRFLYDGDPSRRPLSRRKAMRGKPRPRDPHRGCTFSSLGKAGQAPALSSDLINAFSSHQHPRYLIAPVYPQVIVGLT